jgi:acetolactate synthase-1/2/3 large subunit
MVDLDGDEVKKFPNAEWWREDCKTFVANCFVEGNEDWLKRCRGWSVQHPWLEFPAHNDTDFINAYRFTAGLQPYLRPDEVIVTDMGTALICAHQVLRLKPPQRLMTSGGLGEMGCALPAAIGASFARGRGEVLCLNTDGGMMLNLQELQTIVHHKLPIKIIVYRNEGYLMIRHTQKNARMKEHGVHPESGVSFPRYQQLAFALGIPAAHVRTWEDYKTAIPQLFNHKGPALLEFHMDPVQPLVPKLEPIFVDGKPTSPPFCKMSPYVD